MPTVELWRWWIAGEMATTHFSLMYKNKLDKEMVQQLIAWQLGFCE